MIGIGVNLWSQQNGEAVLFISGSAPILAQTFTGDDLSDFVTWGSATAPEGETLTGASPVQEMNLNGAGWVPYSPPPSLPDLQTVGIRETWAVVGDTVPARTFFSVLRTTVHVAPVAGTLAAVNETQGDGIPPVNLAAGFTGQALVYTSNQPWATVSGSVLTIADEVRAGTVRITATNSGGSAFVDLSVTIAAPVPETDVWIVVNGDGQSTIVQFIAIPPTMTVVSNGDGQSTVSF